MDIKKDKPDINDDIREYCKNEKLCLRVFMLKCLGAVQPKPLRPGHLCCSVYVNSCLCVNCIDK